jgi:hypothetical protein
MTLKAALEWLSDPVDRARRGVQKDFAPTRKMRSASRSLLAGSHECSQRLRTDIFNSFDLQTGPVLVQRLSAGRPVSTKRVVGRLSFQHYFGAVLSDQTTELIVS